MTTSLVAQRISKKVLKDTLGSFTITPQNSTDNLPFLIYRPSPASTHWTASGSVYTQALLPISVKDGGLVTFPVTAVKGSFVQIVMDCVRDRRGWLHLINGRPEGLPVSISTRDYTFPESNLIIFSDTSTGVFCSYLEVLKLARRNRVALYSEPSIRSLRSLHTTMADEPAQVLEVRRVSGNVFFSVQLLMPNGRTFREGWIPMRGTSGRIEVWPVDYDCE